MAGECFYFSGNYYTISFLILLGFSLQSLSQELLLLGQVLLDKAILAHLLADLHHKRENTIVISKDCDEKMYKNTQNICVPVSSAAAHSERMRIFEGFLASEPAKTGIMTVTIEYCV